MDKCILNAERTIQYHICLVLITSYCYENDIKVIKTAIIVIVIKTLELSIIEKGDVMDNEWNRLISFRDRDSISYAVTLASNGLYFMPYDGIRCYSCNVRQRHGATPNEHQETCHFISNQNQKCERYNSDNYSSSERWFVLHVQRTNAITTLGNRYV